jgi:hypothetical protein
MRVLFDHSTPAPLRHFLTKHTISEAFNEGWDRLSNGDLLTMAERAGFDVLLTADKNIRYQQNLTGRKIAIVELSTPQWPVVRLHTEKVAEALDAVTPAVTRKWTFR